MDANTKPPRTATITFTELPGDRVSVKCEFLPDGAEESSAAHRGFAPREPLRCDGCGKTIAEHTPLLHCVTAAQDK